MAYRSNSQKLNESYKELLSFKKTEGSHNEYSTLEYPIGELGGEKYPHYTIIYINENSKASFKDAETVATYVPKSETNAVSTSVNAANIGKNVSNVLDGSTALGVVGKLSEMAGAEGLNSDKINKAMKSMEFDAGRKRLKRAICLPMPTSIRANYSAEYSASEEMGAMGATILAAINGSDISDTLVQGLAPAAAGVVVGLPTKVLGSVTGSKTLLEAGASAETITKNLMQKFTGKVINKRQEQLFNNMNFRVHQFSYLLIPRSEKESDNISQIILELKRYMHPELNGGNGASLLITPAEFDIEFRYGDSENKTLSRIATCALKGLDVNYTQLGEFIAFAGTPNPVAISLDLTFVEMEPLTRSMINKGF